jgi:putative ABC transport system permease protein
MRLPSGVRRLLRLRDPARDVDEELSYHFERTLEELRGRGVSEAEARREMTRRFGDVSAYRQKLVGLERRHADAQRRTLRVLALRDVLHDALRSVVRAPALAAAAVATLALGLGANVTMYGILDRLLLSPPPHVQSADALRRISVAGEGLPLMLLTYPDYRDMTQSPLVEDVAVWYEHTATVGHGADARELTAVSASAEYFAILGAQPALGRWFGASDTVRGAQPVVVISHGLWQQSFGGRGDVIGQSLDFGEGPHTIVGVAPRGLTTLRLARADVWLPIVPDTGAARYESRSYWRYAAVARLRADVSEAVASEQLTAAFRRARAERITSGDFDATARIDLAPLLEARGPMAPPEARVATWVAGVSLILLLIACTNVANLLLARIIRQQRHIAIRIALGISRRRIISQTLLEGMLIGLAGGAAAVAVAYWARASIGTALLPDVAWTELGWSTSLIPITMLAAATAGLLSSLLPAQQAARGTTIDELRASGVAAQSRTTQRTRRGLALAQAALSVLLLVGAGLFVRSLHAARTADLGFNLDGVYYIDPVLTPGSTTSDERTELRHRIFDRLRTHPGLEAVAAGSTAPFTWNVTSAAVTLPGGGGPPQTSEHEHWRVLASDDYFRLFGIDLVRGRLFDAKDHVHGRVAVVNETMAKSFWPQRDAVGACMYIGDVPGCVTVVGVVRDTKDHAVLESAKIQYYLPLQRTETPALIMVRPPQQVSDPERLLREAVAAVDPRIRYVYVMPALERLIPQQRSWRLGALLFSAFGLVALFVAGLGLYAVNAFEVSQRRREIGIRCALGATSRDILRDVMASALTVAAAGIAGGCAVAALLAPRLRELLFGVTPHDAMTYVAVAATLLVTAALAALLPARRAAALDPNAALRAD